MRGLVDLAPPSDKRVAVHITRDAERQLRGGHPWLYEGSITSLGHAGGPGDLAIVFDRDRDFLGLGLFDPDSPIRVRMLHVGKPTTVDEQWWRARVADAVDARSALAAESSGTTAYRLINGENDGFGGLVADRYDNCVVVKLYSAAWIPHLRTVVSGLTDAVGGVRSVILRFSRNVQRQGTQGLTEGQVLVGSLPEGPVRFSENGLRFQADVIQGQKTGHFLDQRENRARVRALGGASVLDVFSCNGGFSVHAAAGGAAAVTSVDRSAHALAEAELNMAANASVSTVASCAHRTIRGDAFEILEGMGSHGERFEVVVIDPPSFAQRKGDVPAAVAAYRRLTSLGFGVLESGGVLVQASCSARVSRDVFVAAVVDSATEMGVDISGFEVTGHVPDHPVTFDEGAYLKAVFARRR